MQAHDQRDNGAKRTSHAVHAPQGTLDSGRAVPTRPARTPGLPARAGPRPQCLSPT